MDFDIDFSQTDDALPGSEFDAAYDDLFIPQQSVYYDDDSSFLSDSSVYAVSTADTEISNNKFNLDGDHKVNGHMFDSDRISKNDISYAFDLSFGFNIGASDDGNFNQQETFFTGNLENLYGFEHVSPSNEIHEMRKFKSSRNELPITCVAPLQVTSATASGSSLLELSNASAIEEQMDKEKSATENASLPRRSPNKQRRASPSRRLKDKSSPYPNPLISDEDDSPSPSPKPRRNGHIAGLNRKTGEFTLVGTYPPDFHDSMYYCPDPICREVNGKDVSWTTKNGYKYHLQHNCLRNPDSRRSMRLRSGDVDMKPTKAGFQKECECGATFKSETGFRMHKTQNESTRDGRCLLKARRRSQASFISQEAQYQQGQTFIVPVVAPGCLTSSDFLNQDGETAAHGSQFL